MSEKVKESVVNSKITTEPEVVAISTTSKEQQEVGFLAIGEKRAGLIDRLLRLSLQRTCYRDWVNQAGEPYLQASGAEKIRVIWGISYTFNPPVKRWEEDDQGRYYIYDVFGEAWLPGGDRISCYGSCSSRHKFFARITREVVKEGKREKEIFYKPLSEINERDIIQTAISNFTVNAVKRILGLRNLTWEQLEKAGIETNKIPRVDYMGTGIEEEPDKNIQMRVRLWDWIMFMNAGNERHARKTLKELTSFKTKAGTMFKGYDDIQQVSEKVLFYVFKKNEPEILKYEEKYKKFESAKNDESDEMEGEDVNG